MVAKGSALILWTAEEDEILRRLYPSLASMVEILGALPGRSQSSVIFRARMVLKLERSRRRPHPGKVVSPVIARDGVSGKACVRCLEWRPLEKFARHSTCAGGRRSLCTTCSGRDAYSKHRERMIAQVRKYQQRNPEKTREIKRAYGHRRAKWKQDTCAKPILGSDIRKLRATYNGLCAYCCARKATGVDHVVPLSRGGAHVLENLLPACKECNLDKGALLLDEWVAKRQMRGK